MRIRPALVIAGALAVGILAADWLRPHPGLVLALLLLTLVIGAKGRRGSAWILVALILFGALRFAYHQTAGRGSLAAWEGERTSLVGTVVGEPEVRPTGGVAYIVAVEEVDGHRTKGRVHVSQRGGSEPAYGERVALVGRLDRPVGPRTPGGFDQAAYLARQSVYLVVETPSVQRLGPGRLDPLRRTAVAARLRLEGVLFQALSNREAALMAGLLFGSRSSLPEDIKESFRATGIFHLLAVSGAHLAMLTLPLLWLLRRCGLGRRWASAFLLPVVLFFIFLTGAGPSILRAGLMTLLVLLGDLLERERDGLNTLGATVMLLLIFAPHLLFDLGFQLSAGATLGIFLFTKPLGRWLTPLLERALPGWLAGYVATGLAATLGAQAMVEPLTLHYFGTFAAVAPLANLLVVGLVQLLVPFGLLTTVIGLWVPLLAQLLWRVGGPFVPFLIYTVKALAALPFAYLEVGHLSGLWVLLWYGLLILMALPAAREWLGGVLAAVRNQVPRPRLGGALLLAGLLATILIWRSALAGPPDELKVVFLDVGQGDAILIQAPGGRSALVDAGVAYPPDPNRGRPGFDAGERVVLPYLAQAGVRSLEYLILTHPDADHVGGGAAVLKELAVGTLVINSPESTEPGQLAALAVARERGVRQRSVTEGEQIRLGPEVVLEVLGPPSRPFVGSRSDSNANCIALRIRYRDVSVMLACDLEAVAEERLVGLGQKLRSDLLKVSHHGSAHSSTPDFLEAVAPRFAVISAGRGNPYGHPHPDALARLEAAGAEVWRTDRHGTITLWTDGFRLRMRGTAGHPDDEAYRPLALLGRRLIRAW